MIKTKTVDEAKALATFRAAKKAWKKAWDRNDPTMQQKGETMLAAHTAYHRTLSDATQCQFCQKKEG